MWHIITVTELSELGHAVKTRLIVGCAEMADDAYQYFLGTGYAVELTMQSDWPYRSDAEQARADHLCGEFGQYLEHLARLT